MASILSTVGGWLLGSWLARVLTGAGLTLVTASWVSSYVNNLLSSLSSQWSGLPADMFSYLSYSGLGTYLSIIGSAILARITITAASGILGIGKS